MPECIVKPWNTRKYDENWIKPRITNEQANVLQDGERKNLFENFIANGQRDPNDGGFANRFIYDGRRVEVKRSETEYRVYLSKNSTAALNAKFLTFQQNYGSLNGSKDDLYLQFSLDGKVIEGNKAEKFLGGPSAELMRHVREIEKILKTTLQKQEVPR